MKDFAVIIDLNGTLVDTEVAFFKAYKDVFTKYDIPFRLEDFTLHWSTKGGKLNDYLKSINRNDLLSKEKEMLDEKNAIFQSTLEERAVLIPGAKDLLQRLKRAEIKLGLDSSSTRVNIDHILKIFGLEIMFNEISSGDMEIDEEKYGARRKKASQLKALADKLNFPYNKCVVIGDAEKDILGAKEAGMKSIAIPNQFTKNNNFSVAGKVIKSFDEITPELLSSFVN